MPRFLPLLLAVLAVLYGGYWFFGRAGIEQAARDALDRPGISYDSLNTIGFPSRFDTTIEGIDLEMAEGRIGWQAPFFQLFMLSYSPHKVIAVWPDRQSLRLADRTFDIQSGRMRASAQVGVSASVPLRQATLEADTIDVTASDGGSAMIARALLAIREAGGDDEGHRYDIFGELTGLTFLPAAGYSDSPAAIRIDGAMILDAPIDRQMTGLLPRRIELRDATLRWAGLTLSGPGEIAFGANGDVTATADFQASDATALIEALQSLGRLTPEGAETLARALAPVTDPDGSVRFPLEFRGGALRVAGIPLGRITLP